MNDNIVSNEVIYSMLTQQLGLAKQTNERKIILL